MADESELAPAGFEDERSPTMTWPATAEEDEERDAPRATQGGKSLSSMERMAINDEDDDVEESD